MKSAFVAALAVAALAVAAPVYASPDASCSTADGVEACVGDDGTYQVTVPAADASVIGRCGGNISWVGMTFPQANAIHRLVCGNGAHLELR
jgi:hypothetical protein